MLFDLSFKTIVNASEGNFRDRGSKFIGYAFPITSETDFKIHYAEIKKLQAKATHHSYAFRLTPDRSIFRINDDGEPSGTAGRPILGVLLSNELTNCAIVVVRYFGGTMLGVPGLINAYKSAAADAIKNTDVVTRDITENYIFTFQYTHQNQIMQLLKKYKARIIESRFDETYEVNFEITRSHADQLLNDIKQNHLLKNQVTIASQ